ncbi:DNA double-strand break repair helicase HerA [uncultured archaeon]|nr:DNA double-strand break repair helicase HerA [uncultured archaeon]
MREIVHNIVVGRDETDFQKFNERGTGIIGKHFVGEKKEAHLTNPVRMDFLRPHIAGIFGKRGTGKSFTLGVLAEEMALLEDDVRKNLSCIIIDAMGIFWSMKNPNDRDMSLFLSWNIKPQRFPINLVIPRGQIKSFVENEIPFDAVFSLNPAELSAEDWSLTFRLDPDSDMGVLLQKALKRAKKAGEDFTLEDLALQVRNEKAEEHVKDALINRLAIASGWGIFEESFRNQEQDKKPASNEELLERDLAYLKPQKHGPPIPESSEKAHSLFSPEESQKKQDYIRYSSLLDFIVPGKITVVDLSLLGDWSVRSLVVGLLSKKVLEARMESRRIEEMEAVEGVANPSKTPMTWIMIDEAHQFLPAKGETPATAPLLQCVKIGREPGVSLVFVTQQPNKLHEAAISQCDLIISHRLTSKQDINALGNIMQTYLKYDLQEYIDALPRLKGAAIILDDNSERIYAVRIRPRMSWHAGGSPSAIKDTKV